MPPQSESDDTYDQIQLYRDCKEHREHLKEALFAYEFCTQVLEAPHWKDKSGWKLEATNLELGTRVYSRHETEMGKLFALTCLLDCDSLDLVFKICHDDLEESTEWNPELVENFKVIDISDTCDVVYMASRDTLGGLVKSRGFTDVRYYTKSESDYTIVQRSVVCSDMPARKDRITGKNHVSVFKIEKSNHADDKVALTWISRLELKGMLPAYLTDRTIHHFMPNYVRFLRQHLEAVQRRHNT